MPRHYTHKTLTLTLTFIQAPTLVAMNIPAYPCAPGQPIIINGHTSIITSDTLHEYTDVSHERWLVCTQPVKKIGSHTLTYKTVSVRQQINTGTRTIERQELLQGTTSPTLLYIGLIASGILATGLFVYTLVASLLKNNREEAHAF